MSSSITSMPYAESEPDRFCGRCGNELVAGQPCQSCASRASTLREKSDLDGERSLGATLWFYSMLLTVVLTGLALSMRERASVIDVMTLGSMVLSAIVVGTAIWNRRAMLPQFRAPRADSMLIALGVAFVTFGVGTGFMLLVLWMIGIDEPMSVPRGTSKPPALVWMIFFVVVQPAIIEEIAFRGIIQPSLERILSRRQALIVTSAMFAVLHLWVAVPQFVMGLVAGWLRNRDGTLWPAMTVHAVHNGLVVGVAYAITSSAGSL